MLEAEGNSLEMLHVEEVKKLAMETEAVVQMRCVEVGNRRDSDEGILMCMHVLSAPNGIDVALPLIVILISLSLRSI